MADAGFKIDGVVYEMPLPSSFDMDEAEIYFKYTGLVVEEFWLENVGWDELKKRPGFIAALAHIAYRRQHPDANYDDVRVVVGRQNRYELVGSWISSLLDEPDGSEDPKAENPAPDKQSRISSETESKRGKTTSPAESSGEPSTTRSGQQDGGPATTGTPGSDGQPGSVPLRQVV